MADIILTILCKEKIEMQTLTCSRHAALHSSHGKDPIFSKVHPSDQNKENRKIPLSFCFFQFVFSSPSREADPRSRKESQQKGKTSKIPPPFPRTSCCWIFYSSTVFFCFYLGTCIWCASNIRICVNVVKSTIQITASTPSVMIIFFFLSTQEITFCE
jgi:hypothetical protein